jgi:ankyrin repeat protein
MDESSPESPSEIPTPLYYSSLCGFSDLVEHLSTKHPQHVNAVGGKYKFPLLAALVGKHIKVAGILLNHGANVDVRGLRERTPLHEAIANVGIVQSLLNKGADVNCQQDDLRTPLHLAAYYNELKVAQVLVEHKADVDSQDNKGKTPLHLLLEDTGRDDDDIVDLARLLLEHTTDVNIRTTEEWTLLHSAAFRGRLEIVRMLLDRGANPNAENKWNATPLHLVSRGKYNSQERGVGIARLLLERGVDVNASSKSLVTPLHWVASNGRLGIARVLLDHGASPNAQTEKGETALHIVSGCEYDSEEHGVGIARLLLEHGVDIHTPMKKGHNTAFHLAAWNGRLEIVQLLLDHGANPNVENDDGSIPLHLVSGGNYNYNLQERGVGIARLLMERGTDVNAQMKNMSTPLHAAAFKGRLEITRLLLSHGANPNVGNDRGSTPLHQVSEGNYNSQEHGVGIARLLLEHGVDVNARSKIKSTPLHSAAFMGRLQIIQVLLIFILILNPSIFLDYRCFSTMVRTRTWRSRMAKRRCT